MPEELIQSLSLYVEMNDNVRHHMHSMAADRNVSDIELTAEASEMAAILSLSASQILIIESDPVMVPVYTFMCENLYNVLRSDMQEYIDKKEAQK